MITESALFGQIRRSFFCVEFCGDFSISFSIILNLCSQFTPGIGRREYASGFTRLVLLLAKVGIFGILVSASFMFVIIVWIGPIFRTLPRSVLSCIVIGTFQKS